jgi:hypothetical protein
MSQSTARLPLLSNFSVLHQSRVKFSPNQLIDCPVEEQFSVAYADENLPWKMKSFIGGVFMPREVAYGYWNSLLRPDVSPGTTLHSFAGIGLGKESRDVLVMKANRRETAMRWVRAKA